MDNKYIIKQLLRFTIGYYDPLFDFDVLFRPHSVVPSNVVYNVVLENDYYDRDSCLYVFLAPEEVEHIVRIADAETTELVEVYYVEGSWIFADSKEIICFYEGKPIDDEEEPCII